MMNDEKGIRDASGACPVHFFCSLFSSFRSAFRTPHSALEWFLILLQIAFVLATRLGQPPILIDDAYTHFHIAKNWAEGHGFVFNEGQRVLATTSPVYVAALSGLYKLSGIDLPLLAQRFNMIVDIALVLIVIAWFRRAGMPLLMRHAAGLILTAEPLRMHYSLAGMEMSFFLLMVLLAFEAAGRGRWMLAGVLLGILGWVRPEGAVLWPAIAGGLLAAGRGREIPRLIGTAVVIAAAMAGGLTACFGTFIPQSVIAKGTAEWYTQSGFCAPLFLIRLGDLTPFYAIHGMVSSWASPGDKINASLMAAAQIGLMAAGVAWLWQRGQRFVATVMPVFVGGWFLFYAVTRPNIIDWYYVPFCFGVLVLAGAGWQALGQALWRRVPANRQSWSNVAAPIAIALLLGLYWISLSHQIGRAAQAGDTLGEQLAFRFGRSQPDKREPQYAEIAKLVNGWIGPARPTVGCTEIGVFGYYYRGPVLDVYGLISPEALVVRKPEALAKVPADCRIFPYAALMYFKPEMFLTWPQFVKRPAPAEFNALYKRVKMDFGVALFVRRDMIGRLAIPAELTNGPEMPL